MNGYELSFLSLKIEMFHFLREVLLRKWLA
jgi:hypothetical protein